MRKSCLGVTGEAGVVSIFTSRLLAGDPIQINARNSTGDPGCVRDYVFVRDVVRANLKAIAGQVSIPVANVGTGVATTTLQLAEIPQRAVGAKADIRHAPRRAGDLERSVLAPNLVEELGAFVPLEAGIAETVAWFRSVRGS